MKNLKIKNKLLVVFGGIMVLLIILVAVSLTSLNSAGKSFTDFYENGYPVSNKTVEMRRAIQNAIKNISLTMLTEDVQLTQQYIDEADKEMANLKQGFDFMEENYRGDHSVIDQALDYLTQSKEYRTQVTELAGQNRNAEAYEIFSNEYEPILMKVQELLTKVDETTTLQAEDNYAAAAKNQNITAVILMVISVITLVFTLLLAVYITKSLTVPIIEIEAAATQMAEGRLDVAVSYESRDELGSLSNKIRHLTQTLKEIISDEDYLLGEMAKGNFDVRTKAEERYVGDFLSILLSMRKINSSLSSTLRQINQASDQVASGSDQVSSGAQALSQGATEQASSIEELAATINDISRQVEESAQNAELANDKTNAVGNEAGESNRRMQDMLTAMQDISNSSSEIGKIIKTIEDIAFQTNILALNAAVEAARAGEAGKGFAVVADEVRNLASKSAEASKNTAALIENSLQVVNNGTRIADETAKSLETVVKGVQEVSESIGQITAASRQQSESIRQVTQGIDQISSVVQTNSATAEESAAASEELSGQSQMLKGLVAQFILKNEEKAGAGAPVKKEESQPAVTVSAARPHAGIDKY